MCAMALTHSRIERVYYVENDEFDGAFTKHKFLQLGLHHSFKVCKVTF
jgi:tRNA(Arg) A34 adenosine deaminase TadA